MLSYARTIFSLTYSEVELLAMRGTLTSIVAEFFMIFVLCSQNQLGESSFGISPRDTFKNYSLQGFVSKRLSVPANNVSCFAACVYEDCYCKSINFKRQPEKNGTHLCELNFETKDGKQSAFKEHDGWDYHQLTLQVSTHLMLLTD